MGEAGAAVSSSVGAEGEGPADGGLGIEDGASAVTEGQGKEERDLECKAVLGMSESEFDRLEDEYLGSEEVRRLGKDTGLELVEEDSEFDRDYYNAFESILNADPDGRPVKPKGGGGGFFEELEEEAEKDLLDRPTDDASQSGVDAPQLDEDLEGAAGMRAAAEHGGEEDGGDANEALADGGGRGEDDDEDDEQGQEHVESVWRSVMHHVRKRKLQKSTMEHPTASQGYGPTGVMGSKAAKYAEESEDTSSEAYEGSVQIDAEGADNVDLGELDDVDRELLEEVGAMAQREKDATLRDACRHIADHVVLPEDHVRHIALCIKAGACLQNTTDLYGWTVLHHAAFHGHARVCRYLVQLGCDLEAVNKDGYTPLLCAARYARRETVQLLVELGANFRHCSKDGETVLEKAKRSGNKRLIAILFHLFDQMEEEEELMGGKTAGESMEALYPDGSGMLRYQDSTGRWQTLDSNTTQPLPQEMDRQVWRPLGWSYKDIDRLNRYERTLPGWKDAGMESDDEEIDLDALRD